MPEKGLLAWWKWKLCDCFLMGYKNEVLEGLPT